MLKRKIDKLIRDYYKTSRNALLITGARQVGKTYTVRQFGRGFKSFIEINFIDSPQAVNIFKNANTASDILLRISAITDVPLIKDNTLIFFDEVQSCPEIVTAIKFLVDEGSYRYILSGSLLGVSLKDLRSVPVGYMGVMDMYPLDFEEFITSVGISKDIVDTLRNNWENLTQVDEFIHNKMIELFQLYLVVGGMPNVVNQYVNTNNLQKVLQMQQEIIRLYKFDIAQYDSNNKLYIEDIFNLIPPELNAKNKRFILKELNKNAKFEHYRNSFLWLTNAGVAIPVYNVEEPKTPLLLARRRNLFKLFMNDVGLLASTYAGGIQLKIILAEKDINYGAIYENAIAQELVAHGIAPYYYNNKRRGEIDFVVELNGEVLPIEVKSGKDYFQHRALKNIMDVREYNLKKAIVFNNSNLQTKGEIVYAPIYMAMFLKAQISPVYYKVDLSQLKA